MLTYNDALEKIKNNLYEFKEYQFKPLEECVAHVLAQPIVANFNLPLFTNSAMDGIAIKYEDMDEIIYIDGCIYAGDSNPDKHIYVKAHGVKIMTGAKLPIWADTVVPIENIQLIDDIRCKVINKVSKGAHIRVCGEDIRKSQTVLETFTYLTPEKIMIAATCGYSSLPVFILPKVQLISTGDEIVELGGELKEGQIYNSSKYFLLLAFRNLGFKDISHMHINDNESEAKNIISQLITQAYTFTRVPYFIISTGAVSAGYKDFIPILCKDLGFEVLFHKVAVRPGKPVFLAKKENIIFLGLPGNPISTVVSWYFWIRPILNKISYIPNIKFFRFPLYEDFIKPPKFTCFYRGVLQDSGYLQILKDQGSGNYSSSIYANVYVKLCANKQHLKKDEMVEAIVI